MRTVRGGLLVGIAAGALLIGSPAKAQADKAITFDIPAQSLTGALREVARQGGLEFSAPADPLRGRQAGRLTGRHTIEDAARLLLAGTKLTAQIADGALIVQDAIAAAKYDATGNGENELVITGTRLKSAPSASPMLQLDGDQIKLAGQTDLGQAIRSVPQNFGGGQNPGVGWGASGINNQNIDSSSTANLRGLGGDATLTLLMEAATNYLNSIQVNDCRLANRMVQIARGDDNMSGIVEEMTGYKSIREGYANSWQQSREKIQANKGNPTEDLKGALANCPAEVTDIFKTGSLLAHAAARVGASEWAGVMRARVGDVYMRWDSNDKVPLFSAIPACPRQDTESADDFLTGRVPTRALNIPATASDCAVNGAGRGALVLARERMDAIAIKIRTRAALTSEEKQFIANVRTLPVYRLLEWGVRQGLTDSVIADTDELVALTLAYQMLNDLTRSIDFALQNAERGATTAGAADAENTNICQTRILAKGIEQLRELRDEVLRQRAQMRQSYMAAMSQANLSASYAGVVRQRDRDARDAAGANANRNR